MFGSSRKSVFKPSAYEPGRRKRRVPRWLVLLFVGVVIGAGGLWFVQENYGPKQLTVEESRKLINDYNTVSLERQNLQTQLTEAQTQSTQSQTAQTKATGDLAQANERIATLSQTLQILQDAVPPDPRGSNIGVRWAEFVARTGELGYRALVMREQYKQPAFQGQFVVEVAGTRNGRADTMVSQPESFSVERFAPLQGSITLPDGFVPRQATVRVTDANGRLQSMRIYFVRGVGGQGGSSQGQPRSQAAQPRQPQSELVEVQPQH